jgi:hypothetical protein
VLKLTKRVATAVTDEYVGEVAKVAVPAILGFSLKTANIVLVKQVIQKLLKRVPAETIKSLAPEAEHPLVDYVIRQVR